MKFLAIALKTVFFILATVQVQAAGIPVKTSQGVPVAAETLIAIQSAGGTHQPECSPLDVCPQ
ncbi:hypothetical protein H2248_003610 [Termitomyces sp. 'cryptogamus']|nr:hypothetical protein H2248_003610 [Termitomyces sp. 'cryptogamus']